MVAAELLSAGFGSYFPPLPLEDRRLLKKTNFALSIRASTERSLPSVSLLHGVDEGRSRGA